MYTKKILAAILIGSLFLNFFVYKLPAKSYSSDKPLFVEISTQWCFACKMLKPTIEELKKQYNGQVEFVLLDATSEDTIQRAVQTASDYSISDFFNSHRNAFPTVGILSPSGEVQKIIVGANDKKAYVVVLDNLLGGTQIADSGPSPQGEPEPPEIATNRPVEPNLSDRPNEAVNSGRPQELSFWLAGQPIPYSAYFQYLVLPKCTGGQVICNNYPSLQTQAQNTNGPIFKPFDPNATRNEKGFDTVVKK